MKPITCLFLTGICVLMLSNCQTDYAWVYRKDSHHLGPASQLDNLDGTLPDMPPAIQLPDQDAVLYQDESQRVNIKGQSAGLPEDLRLVYLTLFSAPSGMERIQRELDTLLKRELQEYGLRIVDRINYAQAIVNGSVQQFAITQADVVTNLGDALMYSFIVDVQVQIAKGDDQRFQEQRTISENWLVIDTNRNVSNDVVPFILESAARHLSEAIVYGWQTFLEGENENDYQIIGTPDESDTITNRP